MQTVVNCVLRQGQQILMLQKPRRGWWVAPGGKVETGESLTEAILREFREETGLLIENPELRGVFTVVLTQEEQFIDHWMLFTFFANSYSGVLHEVSYEGDLEWIDIDTLAELPMAQGDRIFLDHLLTKPSLISGKFTYTPEYELLGWKPEGTMPILQ